MKFSLPELLGKSILSDVLKSFLTKYDLPLAPELNLDYAGDAYATLARNEEKGIFSGV